FSDINRGSCLVCSVSRSRYVVAAANVWRLNLHTMAITTDVKEFEVAAIQMVSSSNVQENMDRAAALIAQAANDGAKLVLLPEYFCIMGHHDRDKNAHKETLGSGKLQDFLAQQAKTHQL